MWVGQSTANRQHGKGSGCSLLQSLWHPAVAPSTRVCVRGCRPVKMNSCDRREGLRGPCGGQVGEYRVSLGEAHAGVDKGRSYSALHDIPERLGVLHAAHLAHAAAGDDEEDGAHVRCHHLLHRHHLTHHLQQASVLCRHPAGGPCIQSQDATTVWLPRHPWPPSARRACCTAALPHVTRRHHAARRHCLSSACNGRQRADVWFHHRNQALQLCSSRRSAAPACGLTSPLRQRSQQVHPGVSAAGSAVGQAGKMVRGRTSGCGQYAQAAGR